MYTQCPDCATAFRVTADVLKQASGKVRCGGCGNAFDALVSLSESKPAESSSDDTGGAPPELTPELPVENADGSSPQAMSAEQSAALLKTLDDLAGSDIRLEDTGVEWRLLPEGDDFEDDEASGVFADALTHVDAELSADAGDSRIDELLDDKPTIVDEILTDTPNEIEAPEVFENTESIPDDELRFDDDTGLPDEFEANDAPPDSAAHPVVEPEHATAKDMDESQVDLAFGDPNEWDELLEEVNAEDERVDLNVAIIGPEPIEDRDESSGLTFAEELEALPDDDGEDADEVEDDIDKPLDIDTQFSLQAEALGIDLSGMRNAADDDEISGDDTVTGEEPTETYTPTGEHTTIDNDLYAAAFEAEQAAAAAEASARNLALSLDDNEDKDENDEIEDDEKVEEVEDVEEDRDSAEDEDDSDDDSLEELAEFIPDSTGELEIDLAKALQLSDELLDSLKEESRDTESANEEVLLEEFGFEDADISIADDDGVDSETIAQPESEEEQTINRMIDQDLLRLAIEDDEGVASTMVLQGKGSANGNGSRDVADDGANDDTASDYDDSTGVETIIMEGEFVRTALEQEALDASAANDTDDVDDAETGFITAAKKTFRGQMVDSTPRSANIRVVGGLVVLGLLLAGQVVHQSRAELATIPAVNSVIAPVYRAVGAPITPKWDVTGWRFEVTRGSTNDVGLGDELGVPGFDSDVADASTADTVDLVDESGVLAEANDATPEPEVLTIFSRIGNNSSQPLPYPLISVSLTDRFEETIGSKVLEPNEYLSGSLDVERLVPPGNTFNAVISVESPSADATGFKLNVCYRLTGEKLRCAIEDFK